MAENRRGLGRGLSALLGEAEEISHAIDPAQGVREIPIELVRANPEQPRRHFAEEDLAELEASIRDKGVLQPILVRPAPGQPGEYEIVAGERRWRAAQRAGLRAVPALVRELGDVEAFEIAVIENIQRADLNAIEEARAYGSLMGR
ncbi:MAG: ParB/RepB/Spo0J family partition protein, partial [Phenylobacterium sp.]|uniref:ParB/RepB/Spo0J family partition protein n=1 Tax=Phenylobacterium sp. TaxID=1871053 RepID=UPI001A36F9D2